MKGLFNPLQWTAYPNGLGAFVRISPSLSYYAYQLDCDKSYKACLEGEDENAWERNFLTFEEAKSACEAHYAEMFWDALSPRAKVALSIGLTTLAQLGITDGALSDIIENQNP